jgi:hypothetical protein
MSKLSFSSPRRFLAPLLFMTFAAAACVAAAGCGCDPVSVPLYPDQETGGAGGGGQGGEGGSAGTAVR